MAKWDDLCGGTGRVPAVVLTEDTREVLILRATARCPGCDGCFWFQYLSGVVADAARAIDKTIIGARIRERVQAELPIMVSFEISESNRRYERTLMDVMHRMFQFYRL